VRSLATKQCVNCHRNSLAKIASHTRCDGRLTIERAPGFAYVDDALGMSMALAIPKLLAALPLNLL
jgi:hypothetical protein